MSLAKNIAGHLLDGSETAKQAILRFSNRFPMPDAFFQAYMEAALWSSTDEEGGSLEGETLSPEAEKQMERDCKSFWRENVDLIKDNPSRAGHDFWLTRNRHGCGFWDGDWPKKIEDILTDRAHAYREQNLYVDDDGLVRID